MTAADGDDAEPPSKARSPLSARHPDPGPRRPGSGPGQPARLCIGLVYDLRDDYRALGYSEEATAEFDTIATVDAMAGALERNGHRVDRIGRGQLLAARLVQGDRWDLVFSIAEGLSGRCREAQVPALLDLFGQPFAFSDALTMAAALDKSVAKRLVRDAGVPTAPFMLAASADADVSAWPHWPAFVKPLAEGTGKGCELGSLVHTPRDVAAAVRTLVQRFQQPALVEAYLPGREYTVGVVGHGTGARAIGVMEIRMNEAEGADPGVYSLRNKEDSETLCTYLRASGPVADRVAELGVAAFHALGCQDSCRLDFRCDAGGQPVFMEANPIAGLHPTHSDLPILAGLHGISYDALIGAIVDSAVQRLGLSLAVRSALHTRTA